MTLNGGTEEETIDHVARERATVAIEHALVVSEGLGKISAEVSALHTSMSVSMERLSDKVDACIGDVRELGRELRDIRPKVDSSNDLSKHAIEVLGPLESERQARIKAQREIKKLRKQLVMAALLAFAGVVGTALGLTTLHHVPGIVAPQK